VGVEPESGGTCPDFNFKFGEIEATAAHKTVDRNDVFTVF